MVDFIAIDLNKFENQMINFIEAYYYILKKENSQNKNEFKYRTKDWYEKLIDLIYYYKNKISENKKGFNLRIEQIIEYLKEMGKKEKKLEFNMIINITHLLYEMHYNNQKNNKNDRSIHLKYKMAKNIYKELICLRNELSHYQKGIPPLEYILRLYEDFYYLIKFMKPKDSDFKVKIDEQFLKEIKVNIHVYLEKNLEYDKSFELNDLIEEFKKFELENNLLPYKKLKLDDESLKKDTKNIIKSIFEFPPLKLPEFNFKKEENIDINNNEPKIIIDKNINDKINEEQEEKDVYEISLDNSSNNSISSGNFSSNSERSSINDIEGNIKKTDETNNTITDSKYDIQNDY